jgi:hypothetical protein
MEVFARFDNADLAAANRPDLISRLSNQLISVSQDEDLLMLVKLTRDLTKNNRFSTARRQLG